MMFFMFCNDAANNTQKEEIEIIKESETDSCEYLYSMNDYILDIISNGNT